MEDEDLGLRLATNIRQLREARGLTQQQMAKVAKLPRATWQNLESGSANPTVSVLRRTALALSVSLEELCAPPRASARLYAKGTLPVRMRGAVAIRNLLPDRVAGMEMERMELPARSRFTGVPHTPGTREYLTCEVGRMVLVAGGERWELQTGDVVVFRGDQRHSYENPAGTVAIGYSVVVLSPAI
jgi:XRE family transcriptional regulator, regulator of sulfur utilization